MTTEEKLQTRLATQLRVAVDDPLFQLVWNHVDVQDNVNVYRDDSTSEKWEDLIAVARRELRLVHDAIRIAQNRGTVLSRPWPQKSISDPTTHEKHVSGQQTTRI